MQLSECSCKATRVPTSTDIFATRWRTFGHTSIAFVIRGRSFLVLACRNISLFGTTIGFPTLWVKVNVTTASLIGGMMLLLLLHGMASILIAFSNRMLLMLRMLWRHFLLLPLVLLLLLMLMLARSVVFGRCLFPVSPVFLMLLDHLIDPLLCTLKDICIMMMVLGVLRLMVMVMMMASITSSRMMRMTMIMVIVIVPVIMSLLSLIRKPLLVFLAAMLLLGS